MDQSYQIIKNQPHRPTPKALADGVCVLPEFRVLQNLNLEVASNTFRTRIFMISYDLV